MRKLIYGTGWYRWFERLVVAALTLMISLAVVLTLAQAAMALYTTFASESHLMDHDAFIKVFGTFMTVLIAMEFNHTVLPDITTRAPRVKVRAVLLVALLALARKVVLVDFKLMEYSELIGLGVLIIAVAVAYWLVLPEEQGEALEAEEKELGK